MKLFKALSNSIKNLLGVLDNLTEGTNELSLMFKDVCVSARQEQALEAVADLKALAEEIGVSPADITKMQKAVAA